jgi:hypothetical protein
MGWYRGDDWSDGNRSGAEDEVQIDLQCAGLHRGLRTNVGIPFTKPEIERHRVFGTEVDGIWTLPNGTLIYFLDGKDVHEDSVVQSRRDKAVDAVLTERDWTVIRFPYTPPITIAARREFMDKVTQALTRLGYFDEDDDGDTN